MPDTYHTDAINVDATDDHARGDQIGSKRRRLLLPASGNLLIGVAR